MNVMTRRGLLLAFLMAGALAVLTAPADSEGGGTVRRTWQFAPGAEGWTHGFADYPVGEEAFHELEFAHRALPPALGGGRSGLYLSGNNHSDDLFMFVKAPVDGLESATAYDVRLQVRIASKAPKGAVGIGGAPGESVVFKAGATAVEPVPVAVDGTQRMNVDIGSQATGGADAVVL